MTCSSYRSLRTVPDEPAEATVTFRLGRWLRFTRQDLPFASSGLIWSDSGTGAAKGRALFHSTVARMLRW